MGREVSQTIAMAIVQGLQRIQPVFEQSIFAHSIRPMQLQAAEQEGNLAVGYILDDRCRQVAES